MISKTKFWLNFSFSLFPLVWHFCVILCSAVTVTFVLNVYVAAKSIHMALNDQKTLMQEFTRNLCLSTWACWRDELAVGLATCVEECACQSLLNVWHLLSFYWNLYKFQIDDDISKNLVLLTFVHVSQHMTPILRQLRWLPIRQRILFKTAMLVYKCRHGMAPSYLLTYCIPTSSHDGRCHLRSAVSGQLSVPRTTTNYGDCSFAVSGPVIWNSLPVALQLDMSLSIFRRQLKTFFMTEATDSL